MTRPAAPRHPGTAGPRRHHSTTARPPGARWSTVYEFVTRTHATELARLQGRPRKPARERGYNGQTVQQLEDREEQHRDEKPWADLIEGHAHVLWQGWATPTVLDRIETKAIRTRGARYNIEQAIDLPWHVPRWVQRRQRWERDDAAHRARWVPPEDRTTTEATPAPRMVKVALWGAAWAILMIMLAVILTPLSPQWALATTTLATAALLSWAIARPPRPPSPRKPGRGRTPHR